MAGAAGTQIGSTLNVGVPNTTTAAAQTTTRTTTTTTTVADPGTPVLVTDQNTPPKGYRLTAAKVEKIAAAAPDDQG